MQQSMAGNRFMLPYLDDGEFKILVFKIDGEVCNITLNQFIGIDNSTMPIAGIMDPLLTSCFINNRLVFVTIFYRSTITSWNFVLDLQLQQPVSDLLSLKMDCTNLNFPIQSFFQSEKNYIYLFFRQGQEYIFSLDPFELISE